MSIKSTGDSLRFVLNWSTEKKNNTSFIILRQYYRALLLLSLAIPFFTSAVFHETHYETEDLYFLSCTLLLVVSVSVNMLLLKKTAPPIRLSWPETLFTVLLFYLVLRTAATPGQSLTSIPILKTISFFCLYLCLRWLFARDPVLKDWVLFVLMSVGIAEASMGLLQAAGWVENTNRLFRIGGSFGNPGGYGNFLVLLFPVSLSWWLAGRRRAPAYISLLSLLSIISIGAGILVSQARIAWFALAVLLLFRSRYARLLTLLCIATLVFLILSPYKASSSHGRLFIWQITGRIIGDHPLFGIGTGQFEVRYDLYQAAWFAQHPQDYGDALVADNTNVAFNEYWQFLAEYGIIGGILLLAVLLSWGERLRRLWRSGPGDVYLSSAAGSCMAFLIIALASYPFHMVSVGVCLVCMLSLVPDTFKTGRLQSSQRFRSPFIREVSMNAAGWCLLSTLLCGLTIYRLSILYPAVRKWKQAESLAGSFRFDAATRAYREAYNGLNGDAVFLSGYGYYLLSTGDPVSAIRLFKEAAALNTNSYLYDQLGMAYQKEGDLQRAEEAYTLAGDITPAKFSAKYHLFLLYREEKRWAACLRLKERIDSMPVKIPSASIDAMKTDMNSIIDSFRNMR